MSPFVASILSILARKAIDYAKNWAVKSARPRGTWLGKASDAAVTDEAAVQAGYKSGTHCRLIIADEKDPLRWRHESGVEYRVGDGISDGGSSPGFLRERVKPWADIEPFGRHAFAFYAHDFVYRDAGCFVRKSSDSEWEWMRLNRGQADFLFFQMLCSTGRQAEVFAIWRAVRRFGGRAWWMNRRRVAMHVLTRIQQQPTVKFILPEMLPQPADP